ncbi:unnamed protein product [Coregonus sp. 'balchen']|nr:unnamed protein product [Coregonus sp. 'balchen']CAB1316613.1 unnamed protein product [Coregonus sp. 'balchen']CAB1320900.1 unnamed protein product [Coregonus sp. 'balchen']CAB1332296.1 unnamed protein product [Coregonus sp. 'balchen']CAB1333327.1 unnamed protein product [Coregonus sp. 'balchen']
MTSCLLDCFEFTDRHTAENLAVELLRVAKEWQVEDKVVCCVSDNAANITKAIKVLKWTHHPCLAHTLNLVVRDALKVIKTTVDKVKAVVEFFHKSTVAAQKLKSTQRQMGIPELRPKQECATRWNSTFDMLKRMLEIKDAIISTLALINASIEPLSQEEWELVKEVCAVLEVRSYLEEPLIQRAEDPLSWWQAKASVFPLLVKVMEGRLCIVATSVPSERIFSKTGQILTERRNRIRPISPSKLRHLIFLNANLP